MKALLVSEKKQMRWDVLCKYSKNPIVGAEIGIHKGRMTKKVLTLLPTIEKYYAIDPWSWYPEYENSMNEKGRRIWNQKKLDENFFEFARVTKEYEKKLKILRMFSEKAANYIKDKELDFCFIDGNHSYEFVKKDIELFLPKVSGLLGGHDYNKKGVKKAVNEMFGGIEPQLGVFTDENNTWWIWI